MEHPKDSHWRVEFNEGTGVLETRHGGAAWEPMRGWMLVWVGVKEIQCEDFIDYVDYHAHGGKLTYSRVMDLLKTFKQLEEDGSK